jgi:hypothetical protein
MSTFTPKQTLIMWHLFGKGGQALQSKIPMKIDPKDREALKTAGLITTPKVGRAIGLIVEDKGWHWAGAHLRDNLPDNFQVLQNWLTQLHKHLERNGQTLADFFAGATPEHSFEAPAEKQRQAPKKRAANGKKPSAKKPNGAVEERLSATQIRERIEGAYLAVTNGKKSEIAPLSKVRARLIDLDRATVDAGLLRILQGDEKATLHQISDPKALSREDREAAFNPGGEPYHVLWIQP